jgi:hypothetical protein
MINHTRTAADTHVLIYGGSISSGSLLEAYYPSLSAAVAEHDAMHADYYVAGQSWQFGARVESLAYIDGLEDGTADYVARACRRCGAEHTDEYSVGDDYQGWYCSRCADYMVAAVWYGPVPVTAARAGVRRLAADNGWQLDPLHNTASVNCDVYVRDGQRINVGYIAAGNRRIASAYLIDAYDATAGISGDGIVSETGKAADVRAWLKAADAVSDIAADAAECARDTAAIAEFDGTAAADSADSGIRELPADGDMLDALRRTLNRGVMVAWINADLINRAGCDVRKSIVLWDSERNFVMALAPAITPALFRERLPLVTDSMHRAGIRYWSVGI